MKEFFSDRVLAFALFMANVGIIVAVAHAALIPRTEEGFPASANTGLVAIAFLLGA